MDLRVCPRNENNQIPTVPVCNVYWIPRYTVRVPVVRGSSCGTGVISRSSIHVLQSYGTAISGTRISGVDPATSNRHRPTRMLLSVPVWVTDLGPGRLPRESVLVLSTWIPPSISTRTDVGSSTQSYWKNQYHRSVILHQSPAIALPEC